MAIAFVCGIFPPENYQEVVNNSRGVIQYAADALQKSIIEGLGCLTSSELTIINLPYIGSYPQRYVKLFSQKGDFIYTTQKGTVLTGYNVRFCNLSGYKLYSRYICTYRALKSWLYKCPDDKLVIVVYAIHTPFLKAAVKLKRKYISRQIRIVLIVPDLPEYMGGKNSFFSNKLRDLNKKILDKLYPSVDGYVLLSKYMVEMLPVGNKPWTIVEGIFNDNEKIFSKDLTGKINNIKTIFYSGTLAKRYGIQNLVEAFSLIKNPNIRLIICGAGDSEKVIQQYSQKDNRIIYKGQILREEVMKYQKQSTLLINPRTPEGEFTKYSFPSKTMEYLASGTPTLLYKLPGIPEEYYHYCFTIEHLGVEFLKKKIEEILMMDMDQLRDFGSNARKFILEKKNPIEQAKKIVQLISLL